MNFGLDADSKKTPTMSVVGVSSSGDPNINRHTTLERLVEVNIDRSRARIP
jgi:hypothetical protein